MNLYSTIVKRSDLKYSDSEKKTQTESLYQQSPFPPSVIKLSHSVNNVVLVWQKNGWYLAYYLWEATASLSSERLSVPRPTEHPEFAGEDSWRCREQRRLPMSIQREAAHVDLQGHKKPCYRQFLKFGLLFDFMWTNATMWHLLLRFLSQMQYSWCSKEKKTSSTNVSTEKLHLIKYSPRKNK